MRVQAVACRRTWGDPTRHGQRGPSGPGKGELLSWERKKKRISRAGGQRGGGNQEADRKVLLAEWSSRVGEASPARRTQKDSRRRRPRLPSSAAEPPPAVAILRLGGPEASAPFRPAVASLGHPGAVSVAKSRRDRKFVSAGASGSRGRCCGRLTWRLLRGGGEWRGAGRTWEPRACRMLTKFETKSARVKGSGAGGLGVGAALSRRRADRRVGPSGPGADPEEGGRESG